MGLRIYNLFIFKAKICGKLSENMILLSYVIDYKGDKAMSDFVSAAEKCSKKAMNALLEANRDRAFALALLLLGDREKAADIATKVINGSWDKITVKGLYSDEAYAEYINTEVASAAALELFGTASKVFRVSKADITPRDIEKSEYEGDIEEGIAALRAALSEIPAAESFVFLLRAFGMSLSNIAKVIVQRDAAAAYFAASAQKALDGKFDIAKAESFPQPRAPVAFCTAARPWKWSRCWRSTAYGDISIPTSTIPAVMPAPLLWAVS